MASNPYVNKVKYGNQTVMDISDTTAEESDVAEGEVFYKGSGERSVGTGNYYSPNDDPETDIADGDYFPFYDTSVTGKRKTLWSNIKAKLKAYIEPFYELFVKDTVGWTGKNLISYPYNHTTKTENGITFVDNGDGTVTVSGTASAYASFMCHNRVNTSRTKFWLKNGEYELSGCPNGGATNTYYLKAHRTYNGTSNSLAKDTGNGATVELNGDDYGSDGVYLGIIIEVLSGTVISSPITFKPMLRLASINDATYEPYHSSVKQTLREAEVIEGKNLIPYPYENISVTQRGITFTANNDGTIDYAGTASAATTAYALFKSSVLLKAGSYKLTGGDSQTGGLVVNFFDDKNRTNYTGTFTGLLKNNAGAVYLNTTQTGGEYNLNNLYGYEKPFTINSDAYVDIYARSVSNAYTSAVSGTIYPMLRYATEEDATYEPYYIPLKDSKFDRSEQGILGAKNLLPYPYLNTTKTQSGITFTDNGDGSVLVNGTATAEVAFEFNAGYAQVPIEDGEYIVSGCPSGGSSSTYMIQYTLRNISAGTTSWLGEFGNGARFIETSNIKYGYSRILIKPGTVCNNLLFKPMIRLASDPDDTWQPYAMTNQELTGKVGNLSGLQTTNKSNLVAAINEVADEVVELENKETITSGFELKSGVTASSAPIIERIGNICILRAIVQKNMTLGSFNDLFQIPNNYCSTNNMIFPFCNVTKDCPINGYITNGLVRVLPTSETAAAAAQNIAINVVYFLN